MIGVNTEAPDVTAAITATTEFTPAMSVHSTTSEADNPDVAVVSCDESATGDFSQEEVNSALPAAQPTQHTTTAQDTKMTTSLVALDKRRSKTTDFSNFCSLAQLLSA